MLNKLRGISFIFYIIMASAIVNGTELSFESKKRTLVTDPEAQIVTVEYPFENKSNESITIEDFDAPCTCMEARLRRADGSTSFTFKPGEKGVVIGKLDFENFSGSIDKNILIRTDKDPKDDPSIILTASVTIPSLIEPDKPAVEWAMGSQAKAEVITIKVNHTTPIHIINHSMGFGADDFFTYEIATITEGKEYKVTVMPKNTETPTLGVLRFYTDHELQRYKLVQVFLSVVKEENIKDR